MIAVRKYLSRARAAEYLFEDWSIHRGYPLVAAEVEALVSECIELAAICWRAWEHVRHLIHIDPNGEEIHEAGKIIKTALPKTQALFDAVKQLITVVNDTASIIQNAEFETATAQVDEVIGKVRIVFPELDRKMADASRAEFLRGDYQTIEDLIREIQGHSVPAN